MHSRTYHENVGPESVNLVGIDITKVGMVDYGIVVYALDNAIRAVRHIAEEERRVIGVNVNRVRQFATIQIRNYYEDRLLFAAGELPETTKKDRENHGLGLKSIQYIVEKYRGTLSVHPEENVFNLNIMIPLPETEKEKML